MTSIGGEQVVNWKQQYVTVPVNEQMRRMIIDSQKTSLLIQDALKERMYEMVLDMRDGPRLRPGRREYNEVMAPVWRRKELQREIRSLMPHHTPGRFVRAK